MRECRGGRNRREWTREWVRRRPWLRVYHRLVLELSFSHEARYRHSLSMDAATFNELLTLVGPWRRRHPLIFRTTSRMKLEVVLFCATCCVSHATRDSATFQQTRGNFRRAAKSHDKCCAVYVGL